MQCLTKMQCRYWLAANEVEKAECLRAHMEGEALAFEVELIGEPESRSLVVRWMCSSDVRRELLAVAAAFCIGYEIGKRSRR